MDPDPPPLPLEEAVTLYESGASLVRVGAVLGRSEHAVRNALVDAGVPLRPPGTPARAADAPR